MEAILHNALPEDLSADANLPGVRPLTGPWLRVDEAYDAQMRYRRHLLATQREAVLYEGAGADKLIEETVAQALDFLPELGFGVSPQQISCPDGTFLDRGADTPLAVLGQAVQEDLCILEKRGDEHVLRAAVLCFPASWTLAEKADRPLTAIHRPVTEYDAHLARRVQRLFDGVQVGRPLWRNNLLRYVDPDLHQPRSENDPARLEPTPGNADYWRAERQSIARMPVTRAVVFSIHSYVTKGTGSRTG